VFNAVSERDEKFKVFADRITSVGLEMLAKAFTEFPILEVVFDSQKAPVLLAQRLDLIFEKNGVKQGCPGDYHEGDITARLKLHSGLVVNLNGKQS
jgi:hypothetical protein